MTTDNLVVNNVRTPQSLAMKKLEPSLHYTEKSTYMDSREVKSERVKLIHKTTMGNDICFWQRYFG